MTMTMKRANSGENLITSAASDQKMDTPLWNDYVLEKFLPKGRFCENFRASSSDSAVSADPSSRSVSTTEPSSSKSLFQNKSTLDAGHVLLRCLPKKSAAPGNEAQAKAFYRELQVLTYLAMLPHPSVIRLTGVSWGGAESYYEAIESLIRGKSLEDAKNSRVFGVLELVEETLAHRLQFWRLRKGNAEQSVVNSMEARITMVAVKLASALQHLHARGVVLRNLSPYSVGFDAKKKVKICDLSEARLECIQSKELDSSLSVYEIQNNSEIQQMGKDQIKDLRYWSPERLTGKKHSYGEKPGDVYAFSILLWELITLKIPFSFLGENESNPKKAHKIMVSKVAQKGVRPRSLHMMPIRSVQQLIESGWDQNPDGRPGFARIWLTLREHYNQKTPLRGIWKKSSFRQIGTKAKIEKC